MPDVNVAISLENCVKGFKKCKEQTASSPSGRHVGHCRTTMQDEELATLHAIMINLPTQHGFAPDRWQQSINLMLEKDPGAPKLHRLRATHLCKADFQLVLKMTWGHRPMKAAVKNKQVAADQCAVAGKQAIEAAIMKTMTFDMARHTCSQLIANDKDATACYDRTLPSLGMTVSRSWGLPPKAAKMHSKVLLGMKHKTKTIHGVSEDGCHNDNEHTAHGGMGQGSGGGPMLWSGM